MGFSVDYILVSDTACQRDDGKFDVSGVYPADIHFAVEPLHLPGFYLTICIKPLYPSFDFSIECLSPQGRVLFGVQASHQAETVEASSRVIMQIPMPPVPFAGAGEYKLVIRSADSAIKIEKGFWMHVGAQPELTSAHTPLIKIMKLEAASL